MCNRDLLDRPCVGVVIVDPDRVRIILLEDSHGIVHDVLVRQCHIDIILRRLDMGRVQKLIPLSPDMPQIPERF